MYLSKSVDAQLAFELYDEVEPPALAKYTLKCSIAACPWPCAMTRCTKTSIAPTNSEDAGPGELKRHADSNLGICTPQTVSWVKFPRTGSVNLAGTLYFGGSFCQNPYGV
jgi:hypothetical protein